MQELKKVDYAKLEDYIENLDRYREELKFREYELMSNHEPENPEGGKANFVSNPIEQHVIKCNQDAQYRRLQDVVNGTERYLSQCDDETIEIYRLKFWDKPFDCNTWNAIADRYYISHSGMRRFKTAQLEKLAKFIGYV